MNVGLFSYLYFYLEIIPIFPFIYELTHSPVVTKEIQERQKITRGCQKFYNR